MLAFALMLDWKNCDGSANDPLCVFAVLPEIFNYFSDGYGIVVRMPANLASIDDDFRSEVRVTQA